MLYVALTVLLNLLYSKLILGPHLLPLDKLLAKNAWCSQLFGKQKQLHQETAILITHVSHTLEQRFSQKNKNNLPAVFSSSARCEGKLNLHHQDTRVCSCIHLVQQLDSLHVRKTKQ